MVLTPPRASHHLGSSISPVASDMCGYLTNNKVKGMGRSMTKYLTLFLSSSSWAQSRRFNITANLLWVLSACSARRIAAFSSLAT